MDSEEIYYDIISPDGIPIAHEPFKCRKEDLDKDSHAKFEEWAKRFESQGYYSSNRGRIPLDELQGYCTIKVLEGYKGDAEDEEIDIKPF